MKATHNVKAYRNNTDTSSQAAFFGSYISHENVPIDALCAQVAALSGQTAIQVRAMLEGSFDAIAELEKEGLVIVHLDGMGVWAAMTGSFPTGDAAFDPERNALVLTIRLDDSLRLALVNETVQMVTDADLTKVRLDNVKDIAVARPVNLVHGMHPFRAAGVNLVLSDEGARVYMTDRAKAEHAVVVDEVHSNQLFTAHTAELLDGGDYTLWVESRGGDAEGPLQRDKCRVKYLRVEDPEPEPEGESSDGTVKVMSLVDGDPDAAMLTAGHQWDVRGEGLNIDSATGDEWMISGVSIEGDGISSDLSIVEGSADKTYLSLRCGDDVAAPGDYEIGVKFELVRNEGLETDVFIVDKMLHVPQA